ncbi:MAG TPA: hypothetical protein VJT67_05025 [Longimicrobiaceae bacterium]|nr:hypothetical protein [Longimicrobiaceae bacterium]
MSPRVIPNLLIASALIGCRSPDQPIPSPSSRAETHAAAARLLVSYPESVDPVPVFVDGQRIVTQDPARRFNLVDPDKIASIQLLSGAAATAKAGMEGSRGVIWIVTRPTGAH